MIKNYMEIIVEKKLPEVLKSYTDICKCSMCSDDIKAITLNNLQPKYVATQEGILYTKTNELVLQFEADVVREIVKAIEIVSKNPRHK